MENNESKKTMSFIQELDFDEAIEFFSQCEYEKAIDKLIPIAINGNVCAQDMLCEVFYEVSSSELNRPLLKKTAPEIKKRITSFVDKGEGWANFIMHCFFYMDYSDDENYDNSADDIYNYLLRSANVENRGLTYLRLGIMYGWGICVDINLNHAQKCYEKAIEYGCKQAYSYLGQHLEDKCESQKVISYYKKGIELGDIRSYGELIKYYFVLQYQLEYEGKPSDPNDMNANESVTTSFDVSNKPKSLFEVHYPKPLYYLDEAEALAIEMLKNNLDNSYYYYGMVQMCKSLYTMNDIYEKKAITYYELAIKHKQYHAYGAMALIYKLNNDNEKAREYATKGVSKCDSRSRLILADLELGEGSREHAWRLAMESWKSKGLGGSFLAKLFVDYNYPRDYDVKDVLKILEISLKNNNDDAYDYIVKLFSNKNYGLDNNSDLFKYQRMAADKGIEKALVDFGKSLLDEDSLEFNPYEGYKYLESAIRKGNVDAAEVLLCYRSQEDDSSSLNEIRNTVIRSGAYRFDNKFFDLLYPTEVENDNVNAFREFMEEVADNTIIDDYYKINKIKAVAKLLIYHYNDRWTISNAELIKLHDFAVSLVKDYPSCMIYFRSIWKELFVGFDVNIPSLDSDWMNLYYAIFESMGKEAEISCYGYKEKDGYDQCIADFRKQVNEFWDEYEKTAKLLGISAVHHKRLVPTSLKSFNFDSYLKIKINYLEAFISILQSPTLKGSIGVLVEAENLDKLFLLNKLALDQTMKYILKKYIKTRIEFDNLIEMIDIVK